MMSMNLDDLDNDFQLSKVHYAIQRVQFALCSHANFNSFIRKELDYAVSKLEQNSNKITFDLSEDQLTLFLLSHIENRHLGIDASHEKNQRGHCDISITIGDFIWHGEAKKHSSYRYLFKGYAQLTERYSTGTVNSSSGGLIIYTKNKLCSDMMASWKGFLTKNAPRIHACKKVDVNACEKNPLVFYSQHMHTVTKLNYQVVHYPVVLHHKPIDPDL
ncbi:hypothetical protein [Pantoea sp. SOD02]|uniref:hypothetical protein n=1 Tax=Pantoea sp. SOD02 TaxID=2970818 RepID=UPI002158185C|nr:hypothetical protein [Pantoea sp. SOD02]UVC28832.1 hypothetical protein NR302_16570 [Pantoea sp. SOD02]